MPETFTHKIAKGVKFLNFATSTGTTLNFTNVIVDSFQITGNTVALEEVSSMTSCDMMVQYTPGKVTPGQITINFNGQGPFIESGAEGTATISYGCGSGSGTTLFSGKVICIESGGVSGTDGQKFAGSVKFQIAGSAATGMTNTTTSSSSPLPSGSGSGSGDENSNPDPDDDGSGSL